MLYAKIINGDNDCYLKVRHIYTHQFTHYQEVLIADMNGMGKSLILDNEVQSTSVGVIPYHEALISHYKPSLDEKVLVVGSGEGCSVDLLIRRGWTSVDAVDIDGKALELIDKFLSDWNNNIYKRTDEFNLIIEDGLKVLRDTPDNYYKYIVLDLTSEAIRSNQVEWISEIYRCLSKDQGTLGWQDGNKYSPSYLDKTIKEYFQNPPMYKTMLEWRFGWAMK